MKTTAIFYFAIIATTIAVELPSNFEICKRWDPNVSECLTNATKKAFIFLANGLESFKIKPLEPMKFELNINETKGPISLKQEYKNGNIYGITKRFEIHDVQIDWDNLIIKFNYFNEKLDFLSDYKVQGKILLLPVFGNGKCKISIYNMTVDHKIYFEKFEKDKESYIRVNNYFLKISFEDVVMHYDNLFDGNEDLGKEMNKLINENSVSFFKEFVPFFEETFARISFKICNKIFSRVPMDKIFPPI